jgi:ankyrin repeat protein
MLEVMLMLEVRENNSLLQKMFFDFLDKLGWTPLMKACYFCSPDIILTLLEAGSDIDAETEQGRTALHELW